MRGRKHNDVKGQEYRWTRMQFVKKDYHHLNHDDHHDHYVRGRNWFVDNILTIMTYVTMFGVEVDEEMVCEDVLCGDCSGEQGEEKEQREMR